MIFATLLGQENSIDFIDYRDIQYSWKSYLDNFFWGLFSLIQFVFENVLFFQILSFY